MPKPCRRFVSSSINQTHDLGNGKGTYECVVDRACSADYCPRRGKGSGIRVPGQTRMVASDATRAEAEGAVKDIRGLIDKQLGDACDKERK